MEERGGEEEEEARLDGGRVEAVAGAGMRATLSTGAEEGAVARNQFQEQCSFSSIDDQHQLSVLDERLMHYRDSILQLALLFYRRQRGINVLFKLWTVATTRNVDNSSSPLFQASRGYQKVLLQRGDREFKMSKNI